MQRWQHFASSTCWWVSLLQFLAVSIGAPATGKSVTVPCGYDVIPNMLLLSCSQQQQFSIPIKVRIQSGITMIPVGTTLRLENITMVRLEPPLLPNIKTLPVEINQCGFSDLQLLPSVVSAPHFLLNLSGIGLLRLDIQDEFAGLSRVTWLDLSSNQIVEVPSDTFNSLTGLLVLNLSSNLIDHLSNDSFCQLSMLRVLDIRNNPMLMTFSLLQLPSLESLDTSMSVVENGVFCRMNNLKRVVLHRLLDQLQCFVFDSLPSLRDLQFKYRAGSRSICLTMACDPHPVLNQQVPFNFTIELFNQNGSLLLRTEKNTRIYDKYKFGRPYSIKMLYKTVCVKNYQNYSSHHNNSNLLTTGCLQLAHQSYQCPSAPPPTQCQLPLDSPTSVLMSTFASHQNTKVSALTRSTDALSFSKSTATDVGDQAARTTPEPSSVAFDWKPAVTEEDTSGTRKTTVGYEVSTLEQQRRLAKLQAEIRYLERVIVIIYSANGILVFSLILLFACCLRIRLRARRATARRSAEGNGGARWPLAGDSENWLRRPDGPPLQQPQSGAAAADATTDRKQPQQPSNRPLEDNSYVTVGGDPVGYQRLPDAFPNMLYIQTGRDDI